MTKKLLSFVAIAVMGALVSANSYAANGAGVQAGLNFAGASATAGGADVPTDTLTKFTAGVLYQADLGSPLYLQPELNYLGAGNSYAFLALPILLKGKFETGTPVRPFLEAGPELRLNIQKPDGLSSSYKSFDVAATFGGGVEFEATPTVNVFVDARYSLGLLNQLDSSITNVDNTASLKLKGFQLRAGVVFAM